MILRGIAVRPVHWRLGSMVLLLLLLLLHLVLHLHVQLGGVLLQHSSSLHEYLLVRLLLQPESLLHFCLQPYRLRLLLLLCRCLLLVLLLLDLLLLLQSRPLCC